MKLIKAHIENFGCLSEQDFDFSEGLNMVLDANGTGKSTLALFVAAMFYGFWDEKVKKKVNGLRDAHAPWQGGKYGGYIDFEYGEKGYRIQRFFGEKPSEDLLKVFHLETFFITDELGENPGITLFGIDGESFTRTVFISDNDCRAELTDTVHGKLGNLVDDATDMNSYSKADEILKNETNRLSPLRATGEGAKLKNLLANLAESIRGKALLEARTQELNELKRKIRAEMDEKTEALKVVDEKMTALSDYREYEASKQEYTGLQKEESVREAAYRLAKRYFPKNTPTRETMERAMNEAKSYEVNTALSENLKLSAHEEEVLSDADALFSQSELFPNDAGTVTAAHEKLLCLQEKKAALSEKQEMLSTDVENMYRQTILSAKKSRTTGILLTVSGVLLAAFAFLAFYLKWFSGYEPAPLFLKIVMGTGTALFLAGILIFVIFGRKKAEKEDMPGCETLKKCEELSAALDEKLSEEEQTLERFFTRFGKTYRAEEFEQDLGRITRAAADREALSDKKRKYEHAAEEARAAENRIRTFIGGLGLENCNDWKTWLADIRAHFDILEDNEREYFRARDKRAEYEASMPAGDDRKLSAPAFSETLPELQTESSTLRTTLMDLQKQLLHSNEELSENEKQLDEILENEERFDALTELQADLLRKYQLAEKARAILSEAKQALSVKYQNPVEEGLKQYLSEILGADERTFRVDANGCALVEEKGSLHEVSLLSHGYRDLTYFAMRIALADAMYEGEKPVLILDDPFVNLDAEKLGRAGALLQRIAERYQILYFTCHESRRFFAGYGAVKNAGTLPAPEDNM